MNKRSPLVVPGVGFTKLLQSLSFESDIKLTNHSAQITNLILNLDLSMIFNQSRFSKITDLKIKT